LTGPGPRASLDPVTRTRREVEAPEHLWRGLEALARDLATSPDALAEQALFAFLRFHGWRPPGGEETQPAPREAARRVLAAADALERSLEPGTGGAEGPGLVLVGDGGPLARVAGDRFVIGRGRHCDLVIDSAKVSREHAIIRREPDGWWIEDLGSSNGTWFDRARVDRRRIADGDEYFICSERIRCVLSPSSSS
jgi:hypothetical protein